MFAVLLLCAMASLGQSTPYLNRFQGLRELVWLDADWILAFRLTSGVQRSAYEGFTFLFNDDLPLPRTFLPFGCLTANASGCCDQHYHSSLLNSWPSQYIDKVHVSVRKNDVEVAYVLFNGTGSSVHSWFSTDRVLNSSWTDLTPQASPHIFSIKGDHRTDETQTLLSRRFLIVQSYGGCPSDFGWLSVQDQNSDVCAWGNLSTTHPFPAIIYSTSNTYVNFNTNASDYADNLVVKVKLLPLDTLLADNDNPNC